MTAQLTKEMRLLRPSLAAGLLLAIIPSQAFGWEHDAELVIPAFLCFCFGLLLIALSAFGREFSMNTFGVYLAQPLQRSRLWWTKVGVLAGAMVVVLAAWNFSIMTWSYVNDDWRVYRQMMVFGAVALVVLFSGGLWTTLLLRQVAAAFWFTLLIPFGILMVCSVRDWPVGIVYAALMIYAAAGFGWAWWYFKRIQEVGWTGGEISLPSRSARSAAPRPHRVRGALTALVLKELQLHQISLLGVAALFLLHAGIVGLRHFGGDHLPAMIRTASEVFVGVWFIVPLFISATAIAEERKLNTLESLLTLPVSRRRQFLTKLLLVLFLGGIVGGALPWLVEGIGTTLGAAADISAFKEAFDPNLLLRFWWIGLAIALIGFYASSLSRSVIQGLAAGLVAIIVMWALGALAREPRAFGYVPWSGWLGEIIFVPTFIFILIRLSWANYRTMSGYGQVIHRNIVTFACGIVFVGLLSSGLYNRVWEFVGPLEPRHGEAQIGIGSPVVAKSESFGVISLMFDGGKLWTGRVGAPAARHFFSLFNLALFRGDNGANIIGGGLESGKDWLDVVGTLHDIAAIRRDGTLWVSAHPIRLREGEDIEAVSQTYSKLAQFGQEKNWKRIISEQGWSVLLLKTDGTLWRLGEIPKPSAQHSYAGLFAAVPYQLGRETNWDNVLHGVSRTYAWKKDGTAWGINFSEGSNASAEKGAAGPNIDRLTALDNTKWRALAPYFDYQIGLRQDGTLWAWKAWPGYLPRAGRTMTYNPTLECVSSETNWVGVTGSYVSLGAIKSDGTLWRWDAGYPYSEPYESLMNPPKRLGTHADWVAVAGLMDGVCSVAADGSIWYWARQAPLAGMAEPDLPLLGRTRRPMLIGKIFP